MCHDLAISYPHMGDYSVVFGQFLRHLFPDAKVFPAPPITQHTLELGSRHSPDFVCSPFKYNIGNYIETLEQGANVLFQTGMGCRYGYYGELQEQILKDMGYEFQFICLSREKAKLGNAYRILRQLGCTLPKPQMLRALLLGLESIRTMDRFDYFLRENIGFETVPGSFEAAQRDLLDEIGKIDSLSDLTKAKAHCRGAIQSLPTDKPGDALRVGIVGELYTIMEPYSNFRIEKLLAREGISVSRVMSVWFLLFGSKQGKSPIHDSEGYLHHMVGANGLDSVTQSLSYARKGYDGIIHMKSFGCIPELNAVPALMNLSQDKGIPILHLSFDSHTSETGIQTRLEAFTDMIRMRKAGQKQANVH